MTTWAYALARLPTAGIPCGSAGKGTSCNPGGAASYTVTATDKNDAATFHSRPVCTNHAAFLALREGLQFPIGPTP